MFQRCQAGIFAPTSRTFWNLLFHGNPTVPFPSQQRRRHLGLSGVSGDRGGSARDPSAGTAGRARRLPRPGAAPGSAAVPPSQARRASLSRHVFRGQRERHAAPGGAAQAGGRRGEDQGLSGGRRASAVLHAERLQGCAAARSPSWKQPLPGAPILCFTVKTGRKVSGEAHGDG